MKVPRPFLGDKGRHAAKSQRLLRARFGLSASKPSGDLYHLAVPPLSREGRVKSETPSDYFKSFPKSLMLLSERGSGPCGAGPAWMEIWSIQEPARFRPCKSIHIAPHYAPPQRRVPAEGRGEGREDNQCPHSSPSPFRAASGAKLPKLWATSPEGCLGTSPRG